MENKFKLAAEVILSRVNPKLKSFDLTNFWKLDEALQDIYIYNTLSGTSQTHEETQVDRIVLRSISESLIAGTHFAINSDNPYQSIS